MILKQSYVLLAVTIVVALINFFGAYFTVRSAAHDYKLRPRRTRSRRARSSATRFTDVFEMVFVLGASRIIGAVISLSGLGKDRIRPD